MVSHTDKETGLTMRFFDTTEYLELLYGQKVLLKSHFPKFSEDYDIEDFSDFQEILEAILEDEDHKKLLIDYLGNEISDEDHIKKIKEVIYGPFDGNSTVCSDCVLYLVNNDLPEDEEQGELIIAGAKQGFWTIDIDNPEEFSRIRCDCCGTTLAGGRYLAILEILEG